MTISYKWLCDYLPISKGVDPAWVTPEKLSKILTSLGLEVEHLEPFSQVKGGLEGLVVGHVLTVDKHPDADKLQITTVDIGAAEGPLQIVCGAPNVGVGQKVMVAQVGATIYPSNGDPLTMKKAKIRGIESFGMICAEDEIGMGQSHDGIMILPAETKIGLPASEYFNVYTDHVYEIGLTPNRSDAMSHLGVAMDVCAYISHHHKVQISPVTPLRNKAIKPTATNLNPITVTVENEADCKRYVGISITGITVAESPQWLKNKLLAIGVRPISNIVDITNFILHETGQPLHAFDLNKIDGSEIRVKNLATGTTFTTLDDKERKLDEADLMICDGADNPLCIAGVFGGFGSGISNATTNLFLESAWFAPVSVRRTSLRHNLRTDAATRFEKGVDIGNTAVVLKHAAALIIEICGGAIASEVIEVYPVPVQKTEVALKYHYLKKLSGKNYHPDAIKNIMHSLGFELQKEGHDDLWFSVPTRKTDINHPADLVEEIMRIDGYDNVEILPMVQMVPAADTLAAPAAWQQRLSEFLVARGFNEAITNSITNSAYYSPEVLTQSIKMLNNLSAELDMLKPSMLETGLEVVRYNLNRRNDNLRLFEFGKTYHQPEQGKYSEQPRLLLLATGMLNNASWQHKATPLDLFWLKGLMQNICTLFDIQPSSASATQEAGIQGTSWKIGKEWLATFGTVQSDKLKTFDINQPVFVADINWPVWVKYSQKKDIVYKEIPRFPAVERDLSLVLDSQIPWEKVEMAIKKMNLKNLTGWQLFDLFESDKLGAGKKSLAIKFWFRDFEKTLTDKEVDIAIGKITNNLESELSAKLR